MKPIKNNLSQFFIVVLLLTLVAGCGVTPSATPIETTAPTVKPPEDSALPEPPNAVLTPATFDGIITESKVGDTPVFTGSGNLTNTSGQILLITVTGSSSTSVADYFKTAQFYFEIRESFSFPADTGPEEEIPNLSMESLLKDTEAENLNIDIQLAPETIKAYPKGVVFIIVDPTVQRNQYNNYTTRDPNPDASDTISVRTRTSAGSVTSLLYRQCVYRTGATVAAGGDITRSNTGLGRFDLAVRGNNAGSNTYRLTGAWNFDYGTGVASVGAAAITC